LPIAASQRPQCPSPPVGTLLWIWTFVRTFCSFDPSAMAPMRSRECRRPSARKGKDREQQKNGAREGSQDPALTGSQSHYAGAWFGGRGVVGALSVVRVRSWGRMVARVRLARAHELETQPPFPHGGPGLEKAELPLHPLGLVHSPTISTIPWRNPVRLSSPAGPLIGRPVLARSFA